LTWRATLSVTSITRIPRRAASAGALSIDWREGPTDVEQPVIATGKVVRKINLAACARRRFEPATDEFRQVPKILNKTANPTRNSR
jgi:hypothetical protein